MRAGEGWRQGWLLLGVAGLMAWSGVARADAVLDWLNRASDAAKKLNYSGVYVYHHGEHVEVGARDEVVEGLRTRLVHITLDQRAGIDIDAHAPRA